MKEMKRVLSFVLCLVMLVSLLPGTALTAFAATGDPVIVVAGSDYQASNSGTTMQNIMNKIKEDYSSVYGILMGGDYDAGEIYPTASHLEAVDATIDAVYPGIESDKRVYIQGNHETYCRDGSLDLGGDNLLNETGAYDTDYYGVYAINYEDFDSAASGLQTYLNGKSGYTKPIFVMSHQPLHDSPRGDNNAAVNLFNVLNKYDDLDIIFLFGHNHSRGYDAYLGNGSIYLKKGDSITVAGGSTETLNFTYMNYGYVGYVGNNYGSADETLTMTAFEIYEDEVIIKRYDTSGQHVLKAAGNTTDSGYTADTNVYGQAVLSLADGKSTISEISADSDDSTNSGTTGGSGNVYKLDTDGVTTGEDYLIVSTGADGTAYALRNNNGSVASAEVTISNGQIVTDAEDIVWTYDENSYLTNGSHSFYLSYNNTTSFLSTSEQRAVAISAIDQSTGAYSVKRDGDSYAYYLNYSESAGFTNTGSNGSAQAIYFFVRTSESGSGTGGGSTVTPEGGDWVTVTEPNGGTTTYTYSQATSITANGKYVIVANGDEIALLANGTTMEAQGVEINGNSGSQTMTSTTELTEWTFSGTTSGTVYNGTNYLYSSSNGYTFRIDDSSDTLNFVDNGNNFVIKGSSRYNGYAFYYNGSSWATSGSNSAQYVRLFQLTGSTPGDDATPGLFAKITGNLEYNVERGLTAAEVLDLVKAEIKGYEYTGTSVPGDDITGTEITDDLEFILDSDYNGAKAGEYAVTIKYNGVVLGVAKVIVPEVAITGYDCQTAGSVKVGASGNVRTGANITVNLEDGTSYTVPVTMNMLTKDGANVSTEEGGEITGITVTYNGVVVCDNFTLTVREPSSYPEYPDEGAVQVNKTGTGIQFQSTGVAQVEISASGIPMNQGVDVLLVLDTSSSMGFDPEMLKGRTRIDVLRECVNALIKNLKAERADGSVPDVDISVVHFNGYFDNKSVNYIDGAAKSTSTLGGVLADWQNVQNMEDTWASAIPDNCSGTNYDHGLQLAYDQLLAKQQLDSGSRKQFVLFMSDGAPFQYNGVSGNTITANSDWSKWILGSFTQEEVAELSGNNIKLSNREFYYGFNDGNGQKHWIAEAIKGSTTETYKIPQYSDTSSSATGSLVEVAGLGATMYTVGLALEKTNMPVDEVGQAAILKTIASSEDIAYNVTSAEGLQECFDDFAGEALMAATNARFVDQMGDAYDLQMGDILDLNNKPIDVENKIEVISYDIWTRAEYLAGKVTADKIGDRKGTYTVLETITFNADGTEVYSDKINNGQTNILGNGTQEGFEDGVIYAKNFMYNTNTDKAVPVEGVSIPTGVNANGLTTGETNMLPAETFYWNIGTIKTTELAMRYYVYLEGSMEGTREAGSYPTNNYANLYYNNYLNQPVGQPCVKDTVSPVLAWDAANVSYAFYLVDENGNIIVNQTTGETGSFANKIAVTNPVVYKEVLLNNTGNVESIEVASLGVLPDGYELYDDKAVYTIQINSDATGSWTIAQGDGTVASTYVTQYDPKNAAAYTNDRTKNTDADFTHTVVWFAVLWKVQALPDVVVIDYGLPVDISVLRNDMFGEAGKLAGIGAYSESLNLDGHTTSMDSSFGTEYTGTYGSAKADAATGEVRYTPANMQMNGYEKFAYTVNYTGATNPGYYYDTVTVIPATTIYYEDSFVKLESQTWNGGWQSVDQNHEKWVWKQEGTTVDGTQAEDRPGQYSLTDANNIYGYDAANNGMAKYSMGSAMKAAVDYDNRGIATFDFWGTGFDVISLTSNATGTIYLEVWDASEEITEDSKPIVDTVVDTYYGYKQVSGDSDGDGTVENGEMIWVVDPDASGSIYQVPVIQANDLDYGKYTAKIIVGYNPIFDHVEGSTSYDFYLDAIRIYDPANDGKNNSVIEDAYVDDHEGWPSYIELRDNLIKANAFEQNVAGTEIKGMVFIDGDASVDSDQLSDYISYGPNNEVYLAAGQKVAFLLKTPADIIDRIHLGIKSADGNAATYTIANIARNANPETGVKVGDRYAVKTATVNTSTDMYYDITGYKNDIIVISNNSDSAGILSITNIKSTYTQNPNAEDDEVQPQSLENERFETYIYMTADAAAAVMKAMEPKPVNPFADIQAGQFFYESVLWAVKNGITNGVDATHFGPYINCNRAQVVTFLWRAAGSPAPESRVNPFTDVPENSWYTDAVLWAVENGITNGLTATTFGPTALCNRAQVVTFLWRANGSKVPEGAANPFADVAEGAFYHNAVVWAVQNGITTGATATTFNPTGICMRAHVVTFLYRAEQLTDREVNGVS